MNIAELKAKVAKMTDGPWGWDSFGEKSNNWVIGRFFDWTKPDMPTLSGRVERFDRNGKQIADYDEGICSQEDAHDGYADADGIVALRNEAKRLIAMAERAEATNKRIAAIVKAWDDWYDGPETRVPNELVEAMVALKEAE